MYLRSEMQEVEATLGWLMTAQANETTGSPSLLVFCYIFFE